MAGVTGREQDFTSIPSPCWSTNDQEEACRVQKKSTGSLEHLAWYTSSKWVSCLTVINLEG